MVLRLTSCSPRRSGLFVTVACGSRLCPPGRARKTSADLTPASRRQDHTTSPSASNIFRPGAIRPLTDLIDPPCDLMAPTLPRPPHPVPYVRDDRDTPLMWDGTASMYHRFYFGKTEIFLQTGLDFGKSASAADLPVGQNQLGRERDFSSIVIPGRAECASPESILTIVVMDSGPVASGRQLPTEGASPNDEISNLSQLT
jgi:hypothetical protein